MSANIEQTINDLKKNLSKNIQALSVNQLANIINYANHHYHELGQNVLDDDTYDLVKDLLTQKDPYNPVLTMVGSETNSEQKVKLPYYLGSMDKIKPDSKTINKWKLKYQGPYLISGKLDGISILITISLNSSKPKINVYTRGNGIEGQDVSYLQPAINLNLSYIQKKMTNYKISQLAVRGELIISKKNFEKYQDQFKNPRNTISGLVAKKDINDIKVKPQDIDFVAFELIEPRLKASQQFETLKQLGFKSPDHLLINSIDTEILSQHLLNFRQQSAWEIDGIIITNDQLYPVNKSGNPKESFAFKMNDKMAQVTVIDVIWNKSRSGYLNPVVVFDKVNLSGCTIHQASGKNAKFIKDHQIGIGAQLTIIRSGEVIPEIINIIKPAKEIKYPEEFYQQKCQWTETGVDLRLIDISDDFEVNLKHLVHFFKSLKVKNVDQGILNNLCQQGYKTVSQILLLKVSDLQQIDGFQQKLAAKIISNIQTGLKNATLVDYMVGSNAFGRGLGGKKLLLILNQYPEILVSNLNKKQLREQIESVDGFSQKLSTLFVDNIDNFKQFMNSLPIKVSLIYSNNKKTSHLNLESSPSELLFSDQRFVLTKFRDQQIIDFIKSHGGVIEDNVTKNTTTLLCLDLNDQSGKVTKSQSLGIKIMSKEQFQQQYM